MNQPTGYFVEVGYKGATYRYYGWAHVPNARCIGEGDWRTVADGKEYKTFGAIVPAHVLRIVADECKKQPLH